MPSNFRIISHRGNLRGPEERNENTPNSIDLAIQLGFDVEIDLWAEENRGFLGHDSAETPVSWNWLCKRKSSLWVHCKNELAVIQCLRRGLHFFAHDVDPYALTSKRFLWCHPDSPIFSAYSVVLDFNLKLVDWGNWSGREIYGVCTDKPVELAELQRVFS